MAFWLFMLIMNLLIPFTMIGFGFYFQKHPPKEINELFGYRTSLSMKNEDTWTYAHKLFGDIWYKLGIVLLVLSIIASIFTIGKSDDFLGNVTIVNESIQLIVLITPIFYVEKKLKETFDSNGNRK